MFCTQCGAAVLSEHKFCTGCGTRVVGGSSESMPSRPAVAQTSPDSDAPVAPSTDTAIGTQGAAKNAIGGIAHFNQFADQNLSGAQAAKWTVAVVGCSAVLAVLASYSIRLLIFVLIWSGIAFAAKSRRLSYVIAIAGGLLGSMILSAFVIYFLQSAGMLQPPGQSNLASISAPSPIAQTPSQIAENSIASPIATADALVGEWSCRSNDGSSVTRERYSSDGTLFWQDEAKPNSDVPLFRAVTNSDGNYQLTGSTLSYELTRVRTEFAPEDAGIAQSLAATGIVTSVGGREVELKMQGYHGGSARISIEGDSMNFHVTSVVHDGVEESPNGESEVCSRVGR
jgi:hypothetical protein